jgi:hypothetical protein
MKSACVLILMAFVTTIAIAQTNLIQPTIVGKWKVNVIDAGIHHDYKTNETSYPEALKKSLQGKKDSAITIGLMHRITENFKNYCFVFSADGKYQEIKEAKLKQEGTYKVDEILGTIETTCMSRLGTPVKQQIEYKLIGTILHFKFPLRNEKIALQSEKEQ